MAVRFDLPTADPDTEEWWAACRDDRLLLRRCTDCEAVHFYPRPFCPSCWSAAVEWVEATGRATLYTWSVVHRNDLPPFGERVPYVAAVVELPEGPRMTTNVVDVDHSALTVGMALEVTFVDLDEETRVPMFRPAASAAGPDAG